MSVRSEPRLVDRRRAVVEARHRRRRTILLAALAASATVAGGWWVATGPLLSVTSVSISGYTQPDQSRVVRTVQIAARSGTMLKLPTVAIREALADSPWVQRIEVHHNWPRGIDVTIVEATPVAVAVTAAGERLLVSDAGRVLGRDPGATKLPAFGVPGVATGEWLRGNARRAPFDFLQALTPQVAARVRDLRLAGGVMVARIADGPEIRIGPPRQLWAKGRALSAVLASKKAAENIAKAEYLDLTVPTQPMLGGVQSDEDEPSTEGSSSASGP